MRRGRFKTSLSEALSVKQFFRIEISAAKRYLIVKRGSCDAFTKSVHDCFHLFSADPCIVNDKDSHAIPLKTTWVLLIRVLWEVLLNIVPQRLKFPLQAVHNLACAIEFFAFPLALKLRGHS